MASSILIMPDGAVRKFSEWGGYPIFHVTSDGACLCSTCVEENMEQCTDDEHPDSGWYITGHGVNWEDPQLHCCNCNGRIESAYAEVEALQPGLED